MLRRFFRKQIEVVADGGNPAGTIFRRAQCDDQIQGRQLSGTAVASIRLNPLCCAPPMHLLPTTARAPNAGGQLEKPSHFIFE
jgi:hypothetical protein